MARPPPGRCVYCVRKEEKLTWDHVFPKSWYPDTTPKNLEKWKVPACLRCNREYGLMEEDLLIAFALCLDPDNPNTEALVKRGLRAIDPEAGRNNKDKKKRAQRRLRVRNDLIELCNVPEHAILPNFGRENISDTEETGAVTIKARYLRRFVDKIVRGICYLEDSMLIEEPYHIHCYIMHNESAKHFSDLANRYGKIFAREPGIEVCRAVTPEDGITSLYAITIWERLRMYAVIDQKPEQ